MIESSSRSSHQRDSNVIEHVRLSECAARPSVRRLCVDLADDLAGLVADLERGLLDLRNQADRLNGGSPQAVVSGWQQAGHLLHEEYRRQELTLGTLQRQAAADLQLAEELVARLQRGQEELRRATNLARAPFEEAAARLFRLPADQLSQGIGPDASDMT